MDKNKQLIKLCLDDYKDWLNNNSNINSTSSYRNYVNNCFKIFKSYLGNDSISLKKTTGSINKGDVLNLIKLDKLLTAMIDGDIKINRATKTIENYRSGYRMFMEFLFDEEKETNYKINISSDASKKVDNLKIDRLIYTNDNLRKIFYGRLVTQDRKLNQNDLKKLMYPARLLNKIFNNSKIKNNYQQVLNNELQNMTLLTGTKDEKVLFKDVKSLIMPLDSFVPVIVLKGNKGTITLYTEKDKKRKVLKAGKGISDISIDHNIPIDVPLSKHVNKHKCFKKLTKLIIREKEKDPSLKGASKISSRVYENNINLFSENFCKDLLEEVKEIAKEVKGFTILHKNDNSSKNNKS